MSLITCPECGRKEVSNHANSCPNCGFNIQKWVKEQEQFDLIRKQEEESKREVIEKSLKLKIPKKSPKTNVAIILGVIMIITSIALFIMALVMFKHTKELLISCFFALITGIILWAYGKTALNSAKDRFIKYGHNPEEYRESIVDDVITDIKAKTEIEREEIIKRSSMAHTNIYCPKCGSTSITTGPRGVNFTLGLIGASKTVNRCANCGYTWKPSK